MKIGILTQYYPPEMGAPQERLSHLANNFAAHGHEVIVLTAMPNYPRGSIYPGYGGLFRREAIGGAQVLRCWLYSTQSVGFVRRITSYLSFAILALIVGVFRLPRLDVLLTESPPLFLGITGYLLSRLKRARWIFNVSDLWPESAVQLGILKPGWGLKLARMLEAFCYRKAWLVTGQSREILADITSRFAAVNAYHLSNGVDTERFRPGDVRSNGQCVALYAGLHGIAQGLEQILEAARALDGDHGVTFLLAGDGPVKEKLKGMAEGWRLNNVRFLDAQPREAMPALLQGADVALVPLVSRLTGAVPSKLYEAMGSGLPVVLMAEGEAARIVRENECGQVVPIGDSKGLAAALQELAANPELRTELGCRGRSAAERLYSRKAIAEAFIKHLEREVTC